MDNRPDHIEDSLRKAFEGFEMPVTDTDWNAIEQGLLQHEKRRKGLFWFISSNPFRLIILGFVVTLTGLFFYLSMDGNKGINNGSSKAESASSTENSMEQSPAMRGNNIPEQAENNVASDDITTDQHIPKHNGNHKSGASAVQHSKTHSYTGQHTNKEQALPESKESANNASDNHADFSVPGFLFRSAVLSALPVQKPDFLKTVLKTSDARSYQPENTPVEKGFYLGMDLNAARMNTQTSNSGIWSDPSVIANKTGISNLLNLNLSGGWFVSKKGWKVSTGASLEGNPATTTDENQYTVKVPKRFLPYFDRSGNLLYWLAVDWKDSVVKSNESRTQVWFELPVNLQKSWKLSSKISFSAGVSFNPGMAVLNRGNMINPFISQSGSYWQYQTGQSADTASIFTDSRQYLNKFRMGNGLMLNLQGKTANFDWEFGFNSRYYYTNIWKENALPWQQKNISIGLQCKLLKKF